ncbi:MAG: hypothetical protein QOH14_911, partial [Pseudonocardiales bacterium]|nr:hypothetical protein [Pseudonocardiales bacterium]
EWPDVPDTGSQQIATATMARVAQTTVAPTPVQTAASHNDLAAADGTTLRRAGSSARAGGTPQAGKPAPRIGPDTPTPGSRTGTRRRSYYWPSGGW